MSLETIVETTAVNPTLIITPKKKEKLLSTDTPESLVSIEDWTSNRLSRSGSVMDTLGAYVNIMILEGHEIDTDSNYEKGFLEFQNRPIEV